MTFSGIAWMLIKGAIAVVGIFMLKFYKEWRQRRDVTLLERYRGSLEDAKNAAKAEKHKYERLIRGGPDYDGMRDDKLPDTPLPSDDPKV